MAAPVMRSSVGQVLRSASAIVSRPVCGSHVLRVDGYSHLKEAIRHGEFIESCDFDVGNHSWRLLWYPNGSHSQFRSHIALYLKLVSDPQNRPVRAQSQFSLLDQLGKPVLPRDVGMFKFSHGDSWGCKNFIRKKELEKSEYLKDDRFTIQCDVSVMTVRKCNDNWAFISQDHKFDEPPVLS
ncbi:unnamed protein product [Urochloa decumbens]|uniref:MATH domain-containing protein n=1 Tax=Urochloa decumbens TaxID=240449 RepID=A0ABC8YUR4_9POAL